jgi:integrase/ribosomal protein L40E
VVCNKCGTKLEPDSNFCRRCGAKQVRKPLRRSRGNGEGSITRRGSTWHAEITLGYELRERSDGFLHKHRITRSKSGFARKQDARDWIDAVKAESKGRTADRHHTGITLQALYEEWLPTHRASASTITCYKSAFKVFADVAQYPMDEQDIDDLQECLDTCGKGRRTRENARAALGLVYKYGIPRNCVPKDRNLAQYLDVGDAAGSRGEGFNDLELEKIKRLAESGNTSAIYVYCHCYLGFRPSALLALDVTDYFSTERAFRGGIKTEAGRDRYVTVSPKIQPYIDRLVGQRKSGAVFGDTSGKPMSLKEYRVMFYSVLDASGIDNPTDDDGRHRLTPHSCRHTFATLMKRVKGADKDKLSLIGHTSTEQLRHYQDVDFGDLRAITDAI